MKVQIFVNGKQLKITNNGLIGFTGKEIAEFEVKKITCRSGIIWGLNSMRHYMSNQVSDLIQDAKYSPDSVRIDVKRVSAKPMPDYRTLWEKRIKAKLERKAKHIENANNDLEETIKELKEAEKNYRALKNILAQK